MSSKVNHSGKKILSNAKVTLTNVYQNETAFVKYNYAGEKLNEFENQIKNAEAIPTEDQNRTVLREMTQGKNEALENCAEWGWDLQFRLELAFGKNSNEYSLFPSKKFKKALKSEDEMMEVLRIIIDLANLYNVQLAEVGQTAEIIAEGEVLLEILRQKDDVQESKKDNKKSATQERYELFKYLYDTVNKLNKAGRKLFANDPVRLALFKSKRHL